MKINGTSDSPRYTEATSTGAARTNGTAAPAAGKEEIRISDLAARLSALESDLSAGGAFDAAKVDRIKTAIANGEFKVNADVVADKLIQSVQELLGRK
jgi:negative regulator of flagellin synthesis FlgM